MKIPEIHGRKKIRNGAICTAWARKGRSVPEIAKKFKLSEVRIYQILEANKTIINIDREWEKTKAIYRAQNEIDKSPITKRDKLDWEAHLQKLLDGGQPLVDNSQHTHIKYEWNNDPDKILPSGLPASDPQRLP